VKPACGNSIILAWQIEREKERRELKRHCTVCSREREGEKRAKVKLFAAEREREFLMCTLFIQVL
jgi:hypothetical protein